MTVSTMITTRNRREDLRRTCTVLKQLQPPPSEQLITADGCTDDTVEFVRSELPGVRLLVNERGMGSVASRNRMMREARGDLVLSLDDDSYPEQLDCLARFVPMFEKRPRLAVLHFPQRSDEYPETLTQSDFGPARLSRSFASSGAVLRRSAYLELPGFESRFFHMYEEPDYGLQCAAAGWEVLFDPMVVIRHHYSGQERSKMRNHHRHARNELWAAVLRCPFPHVVGLVGYRIFSQFRFACQRGWVWQEPRWWWQALTGLPYFLKRRQPISWHQYKAWLDLPASPQASHGSLQVGLLGVCV